MGMTSYMVDALTFIEQIYFEEGQVPTPLAVAEACGLQEATVEGYWKNVDFRNAVQARGIPLAGKETTRALTYEQLMMANMLMNPADRRSLRQKIEDPSVAAYNLTVQQVNGWLRSKTFKDHLQKRSEALFGNAEPAAYKNFVAAIESGDQKAIALYFEMRGIYNPRLQVDVNISTILVRVVEIVSKHVRDPAILAAIAEEMDGLDVGAAAAPRGIPELEAAVPVNNRLTT